MNMKLVGVSAILLLAAIVGGLCHGVNPAAADRREIATFAGGCFWCLEEALDKVNGVISTTSGYTGGQKSQPYV